MNDGFTQVEKAIAAAQYEQALGSVLQLFPAFGRFGAAPTLPNKRGELYLLLKLFNRMQWLSEAAQLADRLCRVQQAGNTAFSKVELVELALTKLLLGRPAAARAYFKQALIRFGKDPLLVSEMAFTFDQQGASGKAEHLLAQLTTHYMHKGELNDVGLRVFNRLINLRQLATPERAFVEKLFKKEKYPSQYAQLAHILAIAARHEKDYEREIDLLLLANQKSRQEEDAAGNSWSQARADAKLALIKHVFPQPTPAWLQAIEPDTRPLVFILGMPRSGTTLLEQIIGAHSRVGNCGESLALDVALRKGLQSLGGLIELGDSAGLRNLPHMSPSTLAHMQQGYVAYQQMLSAAEVITDKQLALIDFVGLLQAFFVNARFVFIERDPRDNCVSLMQRNFQRAPYSNDAVQIIQEGRAYLARMEYWMQLYPEKIYRVRYERLVSEPETQLKALLEACGLDWQPHIMDFHLRDNAVRTPSAGQVRSAINTAAVEKWRRYSRLIEPALRYMEQHTVHGP